MPSPLPDAFAATLKSDATAALAAAFIIGTHHSEVLLWAARMICVAAPARVEPPPKTHGNGVARAPAKANESPVRRQAGARRKAKSNGGAAHLASRRKARDRDDENLREAMREFARGFD